MQMQSNEMNSETNSRIASTICLFILRMRRTRIRNVKARVRGLFLATQADIFQPCDELNISKKISSSCEITQIIVSGAPKDHPEYAAVIIKNEGARVAFLSGFVSCSQHYVLPSLDVDPFPVYDLLDNIAGPQSTVRSRCMACCSADLEQRVSEAGNISLQACELFPSRSWASGGWLGVMD